MADSREGEDRVVNQPEGKSHEKEGSAPQIHLQCSSAQGRPSPGTSSNIRGDLAHAPKIRERESSARAIAASMIGGAATLARNFSSRRGPRLHSISKKLSKHPDALKRGEASEEGSSTKRHSEAGEGSFVIKSPPGDSGLTQGGDPVGLHGPKEQLIKLLLEDNTGTDVLVKGGLGMTALVRKVCEDVRTRKLFDTIAWISVPQKYDPELIREEPELIREEILLQLLFENARFLDDFDADHQEFKFFTESSEDNNARCLIVVGNLVDPRTQKTFEEVLRLVKTYKVIFMARREKGSCYSPINKGGPVRRCETYELEDLSVEEPRGDFPSRLKEVCRLIVEKFEGLPGGYVLHLRNRKWAPMILPSYILPSLNLIQVLEILSNDDRLFCLLYLSIFPEDTEFSCKRVSRSWAAEGFLTDLGKAEDFFKDLLVRKCILPVEKRSDGELSTFRVDNLVLEIIVSLSNHHNLVMPTTQGRTNSPESGRYLCLEGTIRGLNEGKTFQLFSTFMLDASYEGKTTSEASPLETSKTPSFLSKLKHSKVLDLTGAPFQIPDALFELTDVKYLSLRNTSITVIPSSIAKLTYLEFLDLKHSLVTELPREAEGLERIRHILIYHHEKDHLMGSYNLIGFKASCSVGGFKCLEKLCFVEAEERTLEDLGKTTKLRRLGITKLRAEDCKLFCSSLQKLEGLESLNVHAFDEDEIIDLNELSSSPPKFLKHLYLHAHLEKLPNWISSLTALTKIILRWSRLGKEHLATLGRLPNLIELELRRACDEKQLDFKEGQFQRLKILLLDELEGLRSMILEKGTMPRLESLTISRCPWLERIPSGIEEIPTIQKLTFFDMSHEFYDKIREDHEKDDYKIFKHIPEVYFTRWRAGEWEPDQVESTDGIRL